MWTTVLVLGLVVNLEPARLGLVAVLLSGDRPRTRLLLLLGGGVLVSGGTGVVVLFVLHRVPLVGDINPAAVQAGIGGLALVAAAVLARRRRDPLRVPIRSGRLQGVLGAGLSLPSVEFLALMGLIAASGASAAVQASALVVFLVIANLVTLAALLACVLVPGRVASGGAALDRWVRARTRGQAALVLTLAGLVLIVVAVPRLMG